MWTTIFKVRSSIKVDFLLVPRLKIRTNQFKTFSRSSWKTSFFFSLDTQKPIASTSEWLASRKFTVDLCHRKGWKNLQPNSNNLHVKSSQHVCHSQFQKDVVLNNEEVGPERYGSATVTVVVSRPASLRRHSIRLTVPTEMCPVGASDIFDPLIFTLRIAIDNKFLAILARQKRIVPTIPVPYERHQKMWRCRDKTHAANRHQSWANQGWLYLAKSQ